MGKNSRKRLLSGAKSANMEKALCLMSETKEMAFEELCKQAKTKIDAKKSQKQCLKSGTKEMEFEELCKRAKTKSEAKKIRKYVKDMQEAAAAIAELEELSRTVDVDAEFAAMDDVLKALEEKEKAITSMMAMPQVKVCTKEFDDIVDSHRQKDIAKVGLRSGIIVENEFDRICRLEKEKQDEKCQKVGLRSGIIVENEFDRICRLEKEKQDEKCQKLGLNSGIIVENEFDRLCGLDKAKEDEKCQKQCLMPGTKEMEFEELCKRAAWTKSEAKKNLQYVKDMQETAAAIAELQELSTVDLEATFPEALDVIKNLENNQVAIASMMLAMPRVGVCTKEFDDIVDSLRQKDIAKVDLRSGIIVENEFDRLCRLEKEKQDEKCQKLGLRSGIIVENEFDRLCRLDKAKEDEKCQKQCLMPGTKEMEFEELCKRAAWIKSEAKKNLQCVKDMQETAAVIADLEATFPEALDVIKNLENNQVV